MTTKFRVYWNDTEREAIVREALALLNQGKKLTSAKLLREAMQRALPPSRHRTIHNASEHRWFAAGINLRTWGREYVKQTPTLPPPPAPEKPAPTPPEKLSLEELVMREVKDGVLRYLATTNLSDTLKAAAYECVREYLRQYPPKIEQPAPSMPEVSTMTTQQDMEEEEVQYAVATGYPKKEPEKSDKKRLMRVVVVGLMDQQLTHLCDGYEGILDITGIKPDSGGSGISRLGSMVAQADLTVLATKFISHRHMGAVKSITNKYVSVHGGISAIRRVLDDFALKFVE